MHFIASTNVNDTIPMNCIKKLNQDNNYKRYLGLKKYLQENNLRNYNGLFVSTAHPIKFKDTVENRTIKNMKSYNFQKD